MRNFTQYGIITKKGDFKENSYILHLLTPNIGKIKVIAKGAKKPKSKLFGLIDYLNEIEAILYKSGEWYILKSAVLKNSYLYGVSYEVSKFYFAAIEIINQMIFHKEEAGKIYFLIKEYFSYLPKPKKNHIFVFWRFLLRLFDIIGIKLFIEHCSVCKKKTTELKAYDIQSHGFVCNNCYKDSNLILSKEAKMILSKLYEIGHYLEKIEIEKKTIDEINRIFLVHLSSNFDKKFYLKSLN